MIFTEQFHQEATSFERFTEIMVIDLDIEDRPDAIAFHPVKAKVELKNLWFEYSSLPGWIIRDVSLIPRFYEAQKGCISFDGHDIMDLKQKSFRENGSADPHKFVTQNSLHSRVLLSETSLRPVSIKFWSI